MRLQFEGCFSIDCNGYSGGIGVLWKMETQVSLVNYAQNYVHLEVTDTMHGMFRFTSFYGYPKRQRR